MTRPPLDPLLVWGLVLLLAGLVAWAAGAGWPWALAGGLSYLGCSTAAQQRGRR